MMDKVIVVLFLVFIIVANVLGLWFLTGGDLSEIINGCFDANGCE